MILNHFSRKHFVAMTGGGILALAVVFLCVVWSKDSASAAKLLPSLSCFKQPVDVTNSTLELVHIVFRHGPRTPVDTYPNDPYVNDTFYPTGWGHITNSGKQELFDIGKWLKIRYASFLKSFYSPNLVHAQSTSSPRALMSLATVLASMFAPKNTPMEWNAKYNWQPIPIFSEPIDQDTLLLVRTPCPRYFEARDEVLELPEIKAELAAHAELFENLTALTGMPVKTADDVNSLYITLEAEKAFGLRLPDWTKDYYPEKMRFLAERSYMYNAYTREQQKIKGGPFLKKMFKEMQNKRRKTLNPRERKMFIYTGHDWTVGNILSALNVWEQQMPRFSIMTIFELHKDAESGQYFVKIFLRNDVSSCLKELKVPLCGERCALDDLIELSRDVLPNEPSEERCRAKSSNFIEPPARPVDQAQMQ